MNKFFAMLDGRAIGSGVHLRFDVLCLRNFTTPRQRSSAVTFAGSTKRWVLLLALGLLVSACATSSIAAAQSEADALRQLQSAKIPSEKDAAFLILKQTATTASLSALSDSLADTNQAQWALNVLETLPGPEASDVLMAALARTDGRTQCGVAHALGLRGEPRAVPALGKLLGGTDPMVASAAAQALGKIGDREAIEALRRALNAGPPALRGAVGDALFAAADRLLAAGDTQRAASVFEAFSLPELPPQVRAAVFRGRVAISGEGAVPLVAEALQSDDATVCAMAIQLARDLPGLGVTKALASILGRTGISPSVRAALLDTLAQRGDPSAAPAVAAAVREADPSVRLAALRALGELGDAANVPALAEAAASGTPQEREAARDSLASLRRGDIAGALLSQLAKATPDVQIEISQVLAKRGERSALPALLKLATLPDPRVAVAACKALARLAEAADRQALLSCLLSVQSKEAREAAATTYASAGQHSGDVDNFTTAALGALQDAQVEARCGLLLALGQLGGARSLAALRVAALDPDTRVSLTATQSLAENAGPEALPDLLRLAREARTDAGKSLALEGYWRLVEGLGDHPMAERTEAVREGLGVARTTADKRLGLGRLAELSGADALELARRYCADETVRAEAEFARGHIAAKSVGSPRSGAEAALRELADKAANERVRSDAKSVLASFEERSDFVRGWEVCGPFRVEGKEAQQLFDEVFPPEQPGAAPANWRPLPPPASATNFWQADLAGVVGGNHCVVYLRAKVFSPQAQPIRLEMGSDDGLKLWLNGILAHANNAVRGFTAGEDRATGVLRTGWNEVFVKLTQHTLGCALSVRLCTPDGQRLTGLKFDDWDAAGK